MPTSKIFLDTYLREIGVHTPVSLLSFGPKTNEAEPTHSTAPLIIEQQAAPCMLKTLDELSSDAASCRLCTLAETRTQVVFGRGNARPELLLIGEAPGQAEDLQGQPFVGPAGHMLDRMLHAMGLNNDQTYIMNSIKCRPPNNRDPRPDEIQSCQLWFQQQLDILQPRVICLLGRIAAQSVLKSDQSIADLRGHWHDYQGIPTLVSYHPAYLLRSPRQKQKSWQDLQQLQQRLQQLQLEADT